MDQAVTAEKRRWTEEEYLEQEQRGSIKHEFIHGEVFAMAGASYEHNAIAMNIAGALRAGLRAAGRRCQVLGSDQRVHVASTRFYTYPDVSVVCGRPAFTGTTPRSLLNPLVVVEVLSDSTEEYDRTAKLAHYRRIPSLAEVLLVSQDERLVQHYRRLDGGQWIVSDITEGVIPVPALGCELVLDEIYDVIPEDEAGAQPTTGSP